MADSIYPQKDTKYCGGATGEVPGSSGTIKLDFAGVLRLKAAIDHAAHEMNRAKLNECSPTAVVSIFDRGIRIDLK